MRFLVPVALCVVCASSAFAQLDSYTVSVSATSTLTAQPDQVLIDIEVTAPLGADVLSLVASAGITVANLNSAYPDSVTVGSRSVAGLDWFFTLTVPLTNLSGTLTTFANLQQNISRQNAGVSLYFSVIGLQVSPQLQASQQCPLAALVGNARTQAQVLAQSAGFALGEVSAMSTGPDVQPEVIFNAVSGLPVLRVGAITDIISTSPLASSASTCMVTVEFKVQ